MAAVAREEMARRVCGGGAAANRVFRSRFGGAQGICAHASAQAHSLDEVRGHVNKRRDAGASCR